MPDWFDDHLIVTGLSDEQNELLRDVIIKKVSEGEQEDA